MKVKILASGSKGNCSILEDKLGNQIMIDCGISINKIIENIDFMKIDGCIITHSHKDHSLSEEKLEIRGVDIFNHNNLEDGKPIIINDNWKIIPISVKHNIDCFAFIIISLSENKYIFWATDLYELPNISTIKTKYDLMAIEINYDCQTLLSTYDNQSSGYMFHNSLENTLDFLYNCYNKPKNFIGIHTSNSELLNFDLVREKLKEIKDIENCYIAIKEMEFEI